MFREIFHRALPLQILITQTEIKDLRKLGKAAGKHVLSSGVMVSIIGLVPRLGKIKQDDLCFYHTKFREKPMNYKQPCNF